MTDQRLARAQELLQNGQLQEASRLLGSLLQEDPRNLRALHLAGIAATQRKDFVRAIELIQNAIALSDGYAVLYSNLGIAQQGAGDMEGAVRSLRRAVELDGRNPVNHFNLSVALTAAGDTQGALLSLQRCLELEPRYAPALYNLARIFDGRGDTGKALQLYEAALGIDPSMSEAHLGLAALLAAQENARGAEEHFRAALLGGLAAAGLGLGDLYRMRGDARGAVEVYRTAVERDPDMTLAHARLAAALLQEGDTGTSIEHFAQCLAPGADAETWRIFAGAVTGIEHVPEQFGDWIAQALQHPEIDPDPLTFPALRLLRQRHDFEKLHHELEQDELAMGNTARELLRDRLLHSLLRFTIVPDPAFEAFMIGLRGALLRRAGRDIDSWRGSLPVLAAIAQQCWLNEFAWPETPAERSIIDQWFPQLSQSGPESVQQDAVRLCLVGAYRRLDVLPDAQALTSITWPPPVAELVERCIAGPVVERELAAQLPALTKVDNETSRRVRAQYEESPYPRWVRVDRYPPQVTSASLRERLPGHAWLLGTPPQVLIAGCGTGRHAISVAPRYADAELLAVDLSRASLAYAQRRAREYGLNNIQFAQADLLELGESGREFDVIEAVGVLHHLANPGDGWRVLAGLLRPGGVMRVGLYSRIARRPLAHARTYLVERGFDLENVDVREARACLLNLPPGHEAYSLLSARDFYSLSTCRDLLFHVQESDYELPDVEQLLLDLGLQFQGFSWLAPEALARYRERFPGENPRRSLMQWHELELEYPQLFTGMYQFWCDKKISAS